MDVCTKIQQKDAAAVFANGLRKNLTTWLNIARIVRSVKQSNDKIIKKTNRKIKMKKIPHINTPVNLKNGVVF